MFLWAEPPPQAALWCGRARWPCWVFLSQAHTSHHKNYFSRKVFLLHKTQTVNIYPEGLKGQGRQGGWKSKHWESCVPTPWLLEIPRGNSPSGHRHKRQKSGWVNAWRTDRGAGKEASGTARTFCYWGEKLNAGQLRQKGILYTWSIQWGGTTIRRGCRDSSNVILSSLSSPWLILHLCVDLFFLPAHGPCYQGRSQ